METKKLLLAVVLLSMLLLSGCNSVSDFFSELSGKRPYISELQADKGFYTANDDEIKILVKIKNPTDVDYTPKIGVDYPEGVSPVDYQLKNNQLLSLVSIKSKEEKSYFLVFRLDRTVDSDLLGFNVSIHGNKESVVFDKDLIEIEYSSNK